MYWTVTVVTSCHHGGQLPHLKHCKNLKGQFSMVLRTHTSYRIRPLRDCNFRHVKKSHQTFLARSLGRSIKSSQILSKSIKSIRHTRLCHAEKYLHLGPKVEGCPGPWAPQGSCWWRWYACCILLLAPSMQTVAQLTWDHFRDSQAVRYEDLQHVGGRMPWTGWCTKTAGNPNGPWDHFQYSMHTIVGFDITFVAFHRRWEELGVHKNTS